MMNDFSYLNDLPSEVKMLIVKGQTLVDEVKEALQSRKIYFDMTSKMQLKSDCKNVEKYVKLISKGKVNEKNVKQLELSIVRLRTSYDGVVQFFTR